MSIPPVKPPIEDWARPFWSTLIPTCEPNLVTLRQCVQSILAQGLEDWEGHIVIVDDASSTPGFPRFAEEMRDLGVQVARFGRRIGMAGNWNRCLHLSRGQWVHLLHQDDRLRPGFYAAMAEGIRRMPTIGAAFCQTAFVDAEGAPLRTGHLPLREAGVVDDWIEHVFANLTVQCPSIVVRRAVYERLGGFDPAASSCLDYDMWQRIACQYPLWFDPRPLAEYRAHDTSASRTVFHPGQLWRERRAALRNGLERLPPTAREAAWRSGRHYYTRLALRELRQSWCQRRWPERVSLLATLVSCIRIQDLRDIRRDRYPRPLRSRAPVRGDDPGTPRRPRMLLLTEFFPAKPEIAVFGGFQRLRRHVEALNLAGELDAVFLWPENYPLSEKEAGEWRQRAQAAWPIAGRWRFITAESGHAVEGYRHPLRTLWRVLRGEVSFYTSRLTLRTSGPSMRARLQTALSELQPDLIVAHGLGAMSALSLVKASLPPVIYDAYDLEHVRLARMADEARGRTRRQLRWWGAVARHASRRATRRARCVFVCSEHDRETLASIAPGARIEVVPNTSAPAEAAPPAPLPSAVFVGVAHYPPNARAIRWLIDEIWPRVRSRVPAAQLVVVGKDAVGVAGAPAGEGWRALDFLADLDSVYRETRIALCPIRVGSGTRIKIIEAALRARPVVSTSIGAEGLAFEPDREILLADDTESFAGACAVLLGDAERCERMGLAARARAMKEYSCERIVEQEASLLRRAANPATRSPGAFVFIGGTSEPGGLHVHTVDVARALTAAGHDVRIVCPSVDYFTPMLGEDGGIRVQVIPERKREENASAYWRRHLREHGNATVILCRGKLGEGDLRDLIGIRRCSRRLITIEHRNFDLPWSYAWPARVHGLITCLTVSRTIAVSEEIALAAQRAMGIPRARIATCLNWVDPSFRVASPEERTAAKEHLGLRPDALVLGYHGRLAPEKRVDALIRAVAALELAGLPKLVVAIVGDGWKRRELEKLAGDSGVGERIRFLGWQPNPAGAVAAFDLAVLPSLSEGFPLGLMEAMACGAVCLAHPMSSTRRLIRPEENGLLADLSADATFAQALRDLLGLTEAARGDMGAAAARAIQRDFSRERRLPDVLRALGVDGAEVAVTSLAGSPRHLEFVRAS